LVDTLQHKIFININHEDFLNKNINSVSFDYRNSLSQLCCAETLKTLQYGTCNAAKDAINADNAINISIMAMKCQYHKLHATAEFTFVQLKDQTFI
jgi:hypothetical protein